MATDKKKKGKKGKRFEPDTESEVAAVPPELTTPVVASEVQETVKVVRKAEEPKTPPVKLEVQVKKDQKAKVRVTGKVSLNFHYGPNKVSLIQGKVTFIPSVAVDHCKRLGLI